MLASVYTARSESMVVNVPAPAIKGKARGTTNLIRVSRGHL
jgi:hypothetical protein